MMYSFYFLLYWLVVFFFNDAATTEIYTYLHPLSLHDALPISRSRRFRQRPCRPRGSSKPATSTTRCRISRCRRLMASSSRISRCAGSASAPRSEEHTSELQSLMRISYSVFCLKQKTIQSHI